MVLSSVVRAMVRVTIGRRFESYSTSFHSYCVSHQLRPDINPSDAYHGVTWQTISRGVNLLFTVSYELIGD